MSDSSRPVTTNKVDGVLQNYLDQLLESATELPVQAETQEAVTDAAQTETALKTDAELLTTPLTAPLEQADTELLVETPEAPEQVIEPSLAASSVPEKTDLAALNWSSTQGVECLIFKVAGLKLAIPLPLLGGVYPVTDKITPLIGQHNWSLGVSQGDDGKLTIIDSAQLIMPERNISLSDAGYAFFIQLDRSPWALACQEICDTVTLKMDSIKWRGETSKRPWLAGTVIAEMCALVDVPGVLTLLEEHRVGH